ncbi:flagellar motor protein MotB [Virgibacillus halophilus]|uniref:Flagellar motor protein MotB n=1 Tax=Tigheibacillus halophilus TaxID=361280 RepID=A0ABU5C3V7_9BACI|nr:flagellar motor protein MotB [Virgibacillus halophilus]
MRRKKKQSEQHTDESWLLPYSDLLTLLLALFIVLFAMSEVDVQKYKELSAVFKSEFSGGGQGILDKSANNHEIEVPIQEKEEKDKDENIDKNKEKHEDKQTRKQLEMEELGRIQKQIDTYIHKNDLSRSIGTELTDEGLLVTILNDITFHSGSAVVNKEGRKVANEVSSFLDTDPPHQIVISGHADDRPVHNSQYRSNWELSVMRAVNFMQLVLDNDSLDPAKFSAKGYGDQHPIVPNNSEMNMAKNRRVEVMILPNYDDAEK